MKLGTLYLIPAPLGPVDPADISAILPNEVVSITRRLDHFVAENAKTARSVLKLYGHPRPMREVAIYELSQDTPNDELAAFINILSNGRDLGLMSEAGCPAVADPGKTLVALAHQQGFRVAPLVGPSSILLALMASGLNGQHFAFHGYLPIHDLERQQALIKLEDESRRTKSVQIFIETPYRNTAMLDACKRLGATTRLCIACDLTLPTEWIRSGPISKWKSHPPTEDISRRPSVFLLQAA